MKKKHNKTKRYILIEFDGTTTKACTFRTSHLVAFGTYTQSPLMKGYQYSEARLHPDDVYDQNEGIRIALKRLGFEIVKYPFDGIFERFQEKLTKAILTGDSE